LPKRILVVEDEPLIREVIKKRLEVTGYSVTAATDGVEALERVKAEVPDLIVLDLMLPKKDGYAVCVELKNDPSYAHIPILMLTARTQEREVERGIQSGADGYMMKPFDGNQLAERVAELLERAERHERDLQPRQKGGN
jgi:DNA-binding response OmpR family regulator